MAGVLSSLIVAARKDLVQRQADGIIADCPVHHGPPPPGVWTPAFSIRAIKRRNRYFKQYPLKFFSQFIDLNLQEHLIRANQAKGWDAKPLA